MKKLIIFAIIAPLLASCSTITKLQCNNKDWQGVGLVDGKNGLLPDQAFAEHNQECVSSGAVADESAYLAGHTEGLTTFCTYDTGFAQANDGFLNQQICPDALSETFARGFDSGISEFCTADGGKSFGERPGRYQGSCPAATETQFVQSYLTGLELMSSKARREETDALSKVTSLDSSMGVLQAQVRQYNSAIKKAKKAENNALKKVLEDQKEPLDSELTSQRLERNRADKELKKARSKLDIAAEMKAKWKSVVDS